MKKIKLTFWIIGFGCGVMVTAMVGMILSLNMEQSTPQAALKTEPIIKATTKNVVEDNKQEQTINIKNEEDVNIEEETLEVKDTLNQTEEMTHANASLENEEKEEPKTCQITISDEFSGQDICNLLEEKGLVDDGEAFRHYIWSQNKQRALHSGTITLPYGLSYEELLSWLTT